MRSFLILPIVAAVVCFASPLYAAAEAPSSTPRAIFIGKNGTTTQTAPDNSTVPPTAVPQSIEEIAAHSAELPGTVEPAKQPAVDWEPVVQAMQLMIDQQKVTLQAMEQTRADAIENSRRNSDTLERKMNAMESALAAQRAHESESLNRMNRLVVGVAAGFAGTGFVVMVLTAWFFMRTMNKVAEINASLQSQLLALPHSASSYPLVGEGGGQPGNQRLLGALEQLERRIRDLEHTSVAPAAGSPAVAAKSSASPSDPASTGPELVEVDAGDSASPSVATLMAKGQTLLNLDDAEEALICFDAVIMRDPRNADALLKKGTALERLRRMQDALDAYDAAIRQDDSLTMAYLAKGGICNRLERYSEALECYERALRAQQQNAA